MAAAVIASGGYNGRRSTRVNVKSAICDIQCSLADSNAVCSAGCMDSHRYAALI